MKPYHAVHWQDEWSRMKTFLGMAMVTLIASSVEVSQAGTVTWSVLDAGLAPLVT